MIGVLRDGQITECAAGVKDVTTGEPATTDTVYQCGSMTKTWTALAFMQLVGEGKVDLDEPVRTYLPGFRVADPETTAAVTPRHLLNHTNGIEEAFGDPGEGDDVYERMVENIADAPRSSRSATPTVTARRWATRSWPASWRWSTAAVGRHHGDRLFAPLRLTSTSSRPGQVDQARAATGHLIRSLDEGPIVTPVDYLPRAYGPGGNVTLDRARGADDGEGAARTAADRSSSREMMTSRVPIPDPYMFGPAWALGLIVCDWHGETVYATDGSTIGQNARLRILPDSGIAIAMLTNGGPRESFYRQGVQRDPDRPGHGHDPGPA